MKFTPIKTRRLEPPMDNLFNVLDEVLPPLKEKDVLAIASKAVAIHEGRYVSGTTENDKEALIQQESDYIIKTPTVGAWDLTIKNDMVTFAGGIDESNIGEGMLLLPTDPKKSASDIRTYLCEKYDLKDLGVIITDSTALPFRQGVLALSIGHAGFIPVNNRTGTPDLFGREFRYTYVNVVDALAVAAGFSMGETNESTPLCLIQEIPYIQFTDEDHSDTLRIDREDDVFYPLFNEHLKDV